MPVGSSLGSVNDEVSFWKTCAGITPWRMLIVSFKRKPLSSHLILNMRAGGLLCGITLQLLVDALFSPTRDHEQPPLGEFSEYIRFN